MKQVFQVLFSMAVVGMLSMPLSAYWYTNPNDAADHAVPVTGAALDGSPIGTSVGDTLTVNLVTDNLDDPWAYGLVNDGGSYLRPNAINIEGGAVYKFESSDRVAMDIELDVVTYFGWWSGRKVTVYYSDTNAWPELAACQGSRWGGWPPDWETNALWTRVDYYTEWSNASGDRHTGTDPYGTANSLESVHTDDGIFYVRVDINNTNGVQTPYLKTIDVMGTVTAATPAVWVTETDGGTAVTEGDATDSIAVRLSTQPTDVVVVLVTADNQLEVATTGQPTGGVVQLTFTTSDWNQAQTVTVSAVDDAVKEITWPPAPHTGVLTIESFSSDFDYLDAGSGGTMTVDPIYVAITDDDWYCGEPGMEMLAGDFNTDCVIDLNDVAMMAGSWMICNVPDQAGCIETW